MLIMRGARINVMNRGDDTPLHLASSHGHRDIVAKVHTLSMVTVAPGACRVYTEYRLCCPIFSLFDLRLSADPVQSRPQYSQRAWKHTAPLRLLLGPRRGGRGTVQHTHRHSAAPVS